MMTIENGWFADCRRVCWIIATTERGLLFPPLDNRFRKIHLEMYGAEEIAAHRPPQLPDVEHAALPPGRQVRQPCSP